MRGRVVAGRDLVPAFRDDCVVAEDDCAKRSAAFARIFSSARAAARCMNACSVITASQSLSNDDCLPTELKKVEPNPAGAHARAVRHRAAAEAVASSALQAPADRSDRPSLAPAKYPGNPLPHIVPSTSASYIRHNSHTPATMAATMLSSRTPDRYR
jgi:hypothetical protein